MAGPIQGAINSVIGAATAGIAIKQGIALKEEKADETAARKAESETKQAEREAKQAERETKQAERETKQAEREAKQDVILQNRIEQSNIHLEGTKLKSAQMKQRAKEGYINAIREKQLGTRLGTRTSMAEYLIAASGGTLDKEMASNLASTMSSREIRRVKEAGGARSGNK